MSVKIQQGKVVVDVGFSRDIQSRGLFNMFKNLSSVDNQAFKVISNMSRFRAKVPGMDKVINSFTRAQREFQDVLVNLEMEAEERQDMGK